VRRRQKPPSPYRARVSLVLLLGATSLIACWQYGFVGAGIRHALLPRLLPMLAEPEGIAIRTIRTGVQPSPLNGRGLQVVMSPEYVRDLLRRSPVHAWLLPPGLLVDGLAVVADWIHKEPERPLSIPIQWCFDKSSRMLPRVHLQFPATELNQILSKEFAEDWSERGEYVLGHYDLDQRLWFHSLRLESVGMPRGQTSDALQFRARATGRLRYWFRDGVLKARLTADVKQLVVLFTFVPVMHDDGVGFDYSARVEALDISVDNMAPWLEARVADAIAESMERSQNKPRKKAKMARHRLPSWLPLDVSLVVELTEP
jgi:hypothetical protein